MKTTNRLACVALIIASAAASAGTVTRNPRDHALGTDVSSLYGGVTLTKLTSVAGATTYAPTMSPVIVTNCAGYAACALFGNAYAYGGNLYGAAEFRSCYNANLAGGSSIFCGESWSVMQATFTTPTDFVEFHWTAWSDPPQMFAYDAAGNEIGACGPVGPSSCMTTHTFSPGFEKMGTIRLVANGATKIKKVVVGSFGASARIYMMQYDVTKTVPCGL
jgi:hypothetical protein